jgi:CCR4-NOT transcriptional regulation complex NOT5 subunit
MYIFYNMPRDTMQLLAANELYANFSFLLLFLASFSCHGTFSSDTLSLTSFRRRWSYHRELQRWLIPASSEPEFKGNGFERGTYFLFDPNSWEKVKKTNFVLSYDALERPQGGGPSPSLPPPQQGHSSAPH